MKTRKLFSLLGYKYLYILLHLFPNFSLIILKIFYINFYGLTSLVNVFHLNVFHASLDIYLFLFSITVF